jgi:hypothetical protein
MNTGERAECGRTLFQNIPFRRARLCSCSWRGEKRSENQNFSLNIQWQHNRLRSPLPTPPKLSGACFFACCRIHAGKHHAFFINAERVERQQDRNKQKKNTASSLANTLSLSSTSIRVVSVATSIRKHCFALFVLEMQASLRKKNATMVCGKTLAMEIIFVCTDT